MVIQIRSFKKTNILNITNLCLSIPLLENLASRKTTKRVRAIRRLSLYRGFLNTMKCCVRFGGIIQFWHCVLVISMQCFVLFRSIQSYLSFRSQIYDDRHGLDWDTAPLNFFINCIVWSLAFTLMMTFLLFAGRDYSFFGNVSINTSNLLTSPGHSSNIDNNNSSTRTTSNFQKNTNGFKKSIKINFPWSFTCHALAAYFVLLPVPWVIGEQVRNEAINPSKYAILNL